MAVTSAAPRVEMAWICPECGHGSPEPRDRQAHLDAHRQLRQFIDSWDAAAAADRAAERYRRRRPLYGLVVALVVAVLAAFTFWGGPGRDGATAPPSAQPAPALDVPRAEAAPPTRPPAAQPAAPAPSSPRAVPVDQVPVPQPSPSAPVDAADVAGASATAAPPAPSAASAPPAGAEPPRGVVTIRGCLLVVCVTVG